MFFFETDKIQILEGKNLQITDVVIFFLSWNKNKPFLCGFLTDFTPI